MASLLVLVAHSGRTLQLDVQPSTRVDAVQHALVSFTGIPVADQIAMYQGARLDPAKLLGAYRLPVDPAVAALEDHPVFLYCRSYLKPGAALPPPEALPPLQVQVPPLAEVNLAHPLHSAPSPLVRALPDYERHFQHHLATTRAYWDVAQARLQRCRQLLSEQEVQARAADAARANVEAHYNYILNSYQTFLDKYNAQHAAHATLLATFPSDLAALEAIELHPSLQQQQQRSQQPCQEEPGPPHAGTGNAAPVLPAAAPPAPRRLADLYPVQRLRDWAETCNRSHASFGAKVSELEALFQLLRKDVEGLFMQAPSVDLDALGHQMAEHEAMLDEHSSMVQVLSKDLRTVRTLVEDVVRQLGTAAGGGGLRQGALHDAAAAMESIHETHRNRVLPRLAQLDGQLAAFAARVEASKVAMSRDVLSQLQRISGQQSRIRDMKNKLAAFHEVLGRQDAAFAELRVVHRLPSAYRALLAEVVRRSAWHQLYCGQAGRLAEHMARFRDKEAGRRTAFAAQVARYIPSDLLSRAGLATEPPHCQVTVPAPEVPLISVAMADLQRLSYLGERLLAASSSLRASAATAPHSAASSLHHHHQHHHAHHHHHHHHRASVTDPLASGSQHPHQQQQLHSQMGSRMGGAASMAFPGTVAVLDADPPPPMDSLNALEMENARLRAELANHIAAACVRELTAATTSSSGAGGGGGEGQQPAAAVGEPAAAAAGTPRQARVSGGGGGSAAGGGASPPAATAAAAGGSPPQPRRDPAELVAAMQRALGMKDDLIRHQQREMAALAARAASYEERIAALEALLNQRAISGVAGDGSGGGGGAAAGYSGRDLVVEDAAGSPVVAGVCASGGSRGQEGAERRQPGAKEDAVIEPAAVVEPGGSDWKGSAAGIGEVNKSEGTHGRAANAAGAAVGAVAAQAVQSDLAAAGRAGVAGGPEGESSPDTSHDGSGARPKPPPALSVDVDMDSGRASGAASIVMSPFSLQAAQQQQHLQDGLERTTEADSAGPSANDGATAAASHGSRAGSGNQPQRGSSGPLAIPLAPGGMRRGAGAAEAEGKEPRVPMAIGSLPFATSLPAGSALASRLASSPSGGGIGLGLALGFGLAALAEVPQQSGSLPREGEGSHRLGSSSGSSSSGDDESDSSSGGSSGSSSGSGSQRANDGSDAELSEGAGVRMPDSRERVPGSSSGGASSSGGLQFQPSWPVRASGELATAAAGGGAAADAAMDAQQDAAGADGAAAEDVAGACSSAAGGVGAVASSKEPSAAADGAALESAPIGGGAVAVAEAAAEGAGDDADDEGALPDIDELYSDGAWEVASASAAAGADSSGPQSLGRGGASGGSSGGAGGDVGGSGEGGQVCGAEKGAGDGQAAQALEASSGYESVGSAGSAGSAGSDADD